MAGYLKYNNLLKIKYYIGYLVEWPKSIADFTVRRLSGGREGVNGNQPHCWNRSVDIAIEAGHPTAQSQAHRWRYQRKGLSQQSTG